MNQLTKPIIELKELISAIQTNPLSVAILANIVFIFAIFVSLFADLIRPKHQIKVTKVGNIILILFCYLVIISFIFFTNPNSPARIIADWFNYFVSN